MKVGDRVRLKKVRKTGTGTIDEIYEENGKQMAAIVWDISGCMGEGPISGLEPIPEKEDNNG